MNVDSISSENLIGPLVSSLGSDEQIVSKKARNPSEKAAQPGTPVEHHKLEEIVEKFQKEFVNISTNLQFSLDESTGKTVIKVVDKESGEVIRQIPPEDALRLSSRMEELKGLLYDKGL